MKKRLMNFICIVGLLATMSAVKAYSGIPSLKSLPASSLVVQVGGLKTGIFELDNTNKIYKAQAYHLGNNRLQLIFAEPLLLSALKAAYSRIHCVESIEKCDTKNGTKEMHQLVTQAILKIKNGWLKNSNQ